MAEEAVIAADRGEVNRTRAEVFLKTNTRSSLINSSDNLISNNLEVRIRINLKDLETRAFPNNMANTRTKQVVTEVEGEVEAEEVAATKAIQLTKVQTRILWEMIPWQ